MFLVLVNVKCTCKIVETNDKSNPFNEIRLTKSSLEAKNIVGRVYHETCHDQKQSHQVPARVCINIFYFGLSVLLMSDSFSGVSEGCCNIESLISF